MGKLVAGNRITLLRNGDEYFPSLIEAIEKAQREVFLETYIFSDDKSGRAVKDALCEVARRGLPVHVLIDGFGTKPYTKNIVHEMEAAGVEVISYRPELTPYNFRRHRLRRLHRKLAVIDGRVAFVGGINIIDDNLTPGQKPPRFDYAVKIEGPLLAEIYPRVHKLWKLLCWTHFKRRWHEPLLDLDLTPKGSQQAAFLVRDNVRYRRDIEEAYLNAINNAQREILIANAYFFPGAQFRAALIAAAQRGVTVKLLLQGRVEYALLHYASRALYGDLLDGGVEIIEYHKSFLHAKVAVIDNNWATVGSSNIDPFSMLLAREANVVVTDAGFVNELRASLQHAIDIGAAPVIPQSWRKRPWYVRAVTRTSYGFTRFVMGMLGYAQK